MSTPRVTPPGVQGDAREAGSTPLVVGVATTVPLFGRGLLRADRVVELRWQTTDGTVLVTVTESGDRGEVFSWSVKLGANGAHRFRVTGGLQISATATGAVGTLHYRSLDVADKRCPPTDNSVVLVAGGGAAPWTDLGWCPPYRTDVQVFIEAPAAGVLLAWLDRAGVVLGECPTAVICVHPPHAKLAARNTNAPLTGDLRVLAVWR